MLKYCLFFFIISITAIASSSEQEQLDKWGYETVDLQQLTNKPVHISEHPQLNRVGHEKIATQVNALISKEDYFQIILIDGKRKDIIRPDDSCRENQSIISSEPWDSLFAIFSPYVKIGYAPGGIINFKAGKRLIPREFIFSGQNFNMCILHTIDNLTELFVESTTPEINFRFKADAILLQTEGEDGLSIPTDLGPSITLKELVHLHPIIAEDLFQKYVDYVCKGANEAAKKSTSDYFNCSFKFGEKTLIAKNNLKSSGKKVLRNIKLSIE